MDCSVILLVDAGEERSGVRGGCENARVSLQEGWHAAGDSARHGSEGVAKGGVSVHSVPIIEFFLAGPHDIE